MKKILFLLMVFLYNICCAETSKINNNKSYSKFIYGNTIPEITCAPLQACDIALQPAEKIFGVYFGDTERWTYELGLSGAGENQQPHIIFKPLETHIVTNLIITTDKHTYHIKLIAAEENGLLQAEFDYPDEISIAKSEISETDLIYMNLENIDFNYQVKLNGFLKQKPDFYPLKVFNDGAHVYIIMPADTKIHESPALFLQENDELMLVNYHVKKNYYIVDQLFNKAVLVHGVGKNQIKVEIVYQG
jgi:P-type conjugative transfer protein TrbG